MSGAMVKGTSAQIEREGFSEIERRHELASTQLASQAQAEIQARYVVARNNPRDWADVRVRMLDDCKRPGFAERAFYAIERRGAKPGRLTGRPGVVEGLSVRFAEGAIRIAGNVLTQTRTIYDDDYKRMINVTVSDLEGNSAYGRDIVIEKTIERSKPRDGAVVLGQRTNSAGEAVFIVQATEDELLQKEGNLVSKRFRTEALRLVPADILEECEREIVKTMKSEIAKDPDAERKKIADVFAGLNILPSDLAAYLGHGLAQCSPAELMTLRGLFGAIRDGEVSWAEAMAEKQAPVAEPGAQPTNKAQSVAAKVAARAQRVAVARQQQAAAKPTEPQDAAAKPMTREPGQEG